MGLTRSNNKVVDFIDDCHAFPLESRAKFSSFFRNFTGVRDCRMKYMLRERVSGFSS